MALYNLFFKGVFAKMDPERAHNLAGRAIELVGYASLAPLAKLIFTNKQGSTIRVFGRDVHSVLGIAAGFDKNARMARGLVNLGFGFVEIGTVTAHPQSGNEKPRLFRIVEKEALRNRMGFNNDGADVIASRLHDLRSTKAGRNLLLGVNIGKSKITSAEEAHADYEYSARKLAPYADYLVINVSSPNTPGLRDLQAVTSLEPIVDAVKVAATEAASREVPVLVKIAPDLADEDVTEVAELVSRTGITGVIAANTTISHDYGPGGLSGPMLKSRGVKMVSDLRDQLGSEPIIIGVGGITTSQDVRDYLNAGATLVQGYTSFIYGGPFWPKRTSGTR